jgi:hypothetical protein
MFGGSERYGVYVGVYEFGQEVALCRGCDCFCIVSEMRSGRDRRCQGSTISFIIVRVVLGRIDCCHTT